MNMYRRGTIAVVALAMSLAATPAFAQAATQKPAPAPKQQVNTGFGIGALGGINWTTVRTETNDFNVDFKSGTGWQLGVWFGGNRDGRVGLMGEVSYATKKVSGTDDEGEAKVERSYVQIPVLLRINAGSRERDKPSFYFLAGPVFDIQINTKQNGVDTPDDIYEGLEIGLMFGAGFEVARIGIEGRYSYGFKSVLATDLAEAEGFGSVKFNTFSLVAKVRFN
jgi:hypothetical protein